VDLVASTEIGSGPSSGHRRHCASRPGVRLPGPDLHERGRPVQYLADMVVLISDAATGDPALAVIIEPQLRDSDTALQLAGLRHTAAASRMPAAVLVCCARNLAEGTSARQLIRTGHPASTWPRVVIDSGGPPADGATPYLTVFAASMGGIDMETEPGARGPRRHRSTEVSAADGCG